MSEREIRIGDAERQHALELLGTHLGEGRLTVDEYGDRSARVTTAKTRGDLLALFADLPAPRPRFTAVDPPPVRETPVPAARRASVRRAGEFDPRVRNALVTVVALVSVVLYFAAKTPLVFLLVPATMLLVSRIGGR
ncbi:DUF1707 domain-containing protein [Saccharothrix sp. HUAS TT1]|uniref:DUF1707 SHOCT-like domain-containing protein n=1 Tax=unclassified Saccharothrix TaxID=2593673 RepID=UPI00345C00F0